VEAFIKTRSLEIIGALSSTLCHNRTPVASGFLIHLYALSEGFIKLIVDGSFLNHRRSVACGGIFCDNLGHYIKSFSFCLGDYSVMHAELWGIVKGLHIVA